VGWVFKGVRKPLTIDKRLIKRYNVVADVRGRLATLILNLWSGREVVFVTVYEALSLAIALATLVAILINGK
jgi:hypothetical protein